MKEQQAVEFIRNVLEERMEVNKRRAQECKAKGDHAGWMEYWHAAGELNVVLATLNAVTARPHKSIFEEG